MTPLYISMVWEHFRHLRLCWQNCPDLKRPNIGCQCVCRVSMLIFPTENQGNPKKKNLLSDKPPIIRININICSFWGLVSNALYNLSNCLRCKLQFWGYGTADTSCLLSFFLLDAIFWICSVFEGQFGPFFRPKIQNSIQKTEELQFFGRGSVMFVKVTLYPSLKGCLLTFFLLST